MSKVIVVDKSDQPNLDTDWRERLIKRGEIAVKKGLPWHEFDYKSSSTDATHYVAIRKTQKDEIIGACKCPAQENSPKPCKHLYAAVLHCEESGYGEIVIEQSKISEVIEEQKKQSGGMGMVEENKRIWNQVNRPPAEMLKLILGGRLKNMSNINPQWRYEKLTEIFGICGFGWKYTVDNKWLEMGADDEICAFVDVSLYVKIDGEWSEAIPGSGGSKLVANEKSGLYTNDEAYKMATTDAISVAAKMLGVGADIYKNQWDGDKYSSVAPEDADSKEADWRIACQSAAEKPLEEYRVWWDKNAEQIKKDCGDARAGQVYKLFVDLGKKKASEG